MFWKNLSYLFPPLFPLYPALPPNPSLTLLAHYPPLALYTAVFYLPLEIPSLLTNFLTSTVIQMKRTYLKIQR